MMTPLKWVFLGLLTLVLVVGIAYYSSVQNITTDTTSEVEMLAEAVSAGIIRSEIASRDDFGFIDKDELVANLVVHIAEVQTNHGYNVNVSYVFLDKDGNPTDTDDRIRAIQFQVQLLNADGSVRGTAEKRMSLNYELH